MEFQLGKTVIFPYISWYFQMRTSSLKKITARKKKHTFFPENRLTFGPSFAKFVKYCIDSQLSMGKKYCSSLLGSIFSSACTETSLFTRLVDEFPRMQKVYKAVWSQFLPQN